MMQSIQNYFSFYLSFHTFRPLQCGLSIGWSPMGNILFVWCSLLHRLWCGYLLWDLEHVLFFLLWSWRSHCCFSLVFLLLFCLCGFFFSFSFFFLPFLYVFAQRCHTYGLSPCALQWGCWRQLELAVPNMVQPWLLLTETTLQSPSDNSWPPTPSTKFFTHPLSWNTFLSLCF